jgi:hypothetical protein
VLGRENLDFVGEAVSAEFVALEQIHGLSFCGNVELPLSKGVIFKAVDWLVSLRRDREAAEEQGKSSSL